MEEIVYIPPLKSPSIFDTHSHYDDLRFKTLSGEILGNMEKYGISGVISCSCDGNSCKNNASLSEKYDSVYFASGIHPENLESKTSIDEIKKYATHKKCVAIGEIGLDYHYRDDNKSEQREVFEKQILLAKELDMPVIVHDRDAHADTLEILKRYKPKGVLHCFSGSEEMAEEILKIGMHIGVGGVITFKNAKRLPQVVKMLPDDRLLLETDCPYLAPEPHRGKLCYSGMIYLTAEKIAEIRNCTTEEILNLNILNAKKLFLKK
ncbi:MAG: TatD family hydrolase [Clostridia bacterium]|nr:TatD family hydrolase [Clostridia bacterium]